jgi:hypothetical protein
MKISTRLFSSKSVQTIKRLGKTLEKVQTIVTKFTEYKNKYKEIIGNLRRIIMLNKIGLVFQGNKTSKILNFVFSIK